MIGSLIVSNYRYLLDIWENYRLKELSEGGLDPASILKFEEEKRQQQREEELLKIQEKHLLALLTRENVFIAKQLLLNDIKAHGENVRKEVTNKRCFNIGYS